MHTRTSFCGSRPSELRSVSLPNRPHVVRIAVHSFIYGHNGGYCDAVGWKIIIPGKKATQSRPGTQTNSLTSCLIDTIPLKMEIPSSESLCLQVTKYMSRKQA